jgi:hypothetical protein
MESPGAETITLVIDAKVGLSPTAGNQSGTPRHPPGASRIVQASMSLAVRFSPPVLGSLAHRDSRRAGTRSSALAFLIICCLHALPAAGQASRLLPQDEAARQADFFSFRARLLTAVARRDTAGLLAAVAPEIRNTFGDDNGVEAFRRRWRLDAPDSELWGELAAVLALGGTFENESTFVAPYVFSRWPSRYDAFEYLAVVASSVRVRSEPSSTASVLARSSFQVIRRAGTTPRPLTPQEDARWEPVRLADGRIGYMAEEFLRSPVGYRAFFSRRENGWAMVSFVAGD